MFSHRSLGTFFLFSKSALFGARKRCRLGMTFDAARSPPLLTEARCIMRVQAHIALMRSVLGGRCSTWSQSSIIEESSASVTKISISLVPIQGILDFVSRGI